MSVRHKDIEIYKKYMDNKTCEDFDDELLHKIVVLFNAEKKKEKLKKKQPIKVDKTTDKYIIILQFINEILKTYNMVEVDDLYDVSLPRYILTSENTKKVYEQFEDNIFTHFNKGACYWYARNRIEHYGLTCLKCMIEDIGLHFYSAKMKDNNGKNIIAYKIKP
jgi:hypothetical protein